MSNEELSKLVIQLQADINDIKANFDIKLKELKDEIAVLKVENDNDGIYLDGCNKVVQNYIQSNISKEDK